jgi:hypothetical protein
VPPDNGLGLDYRHSVQHGGKQAIEPDEEQSVRHPQARYFNWKKKYDGALVPLDRGSAKAMMSALEKTVMNA